jgi:hypothetical protein
MQDSVALRLVKRVFQPNERLGIDANDHSLYIIDQGKADLQYARTHFSKTIGKTLRTINKETQKDNLSVTSNLFGFTAVILRRRVSLTALSREFIVTYELRQKDFDELVALYPSDFETVCQLRDTILNTDIPESYEGPELLNPQTHFVPVKMLAIYNYLRNISQQRRPKERYAKKKSFGKFDFIHDPISE